MSSDSTSSEVTYTSISSHGDPLWAVDLFRLLEPDSPEVAPASPDYVPGLEEPEQAPLSLDYVPGLEYPEYLALSDEEVPVEDQPYAAVDSPIALSLGYIVDSDSEKDLEEDSKDGPVDYPADRGDNDDDDDDDDSSNDDEEEASKEEEEEHLALADSVVAPAVDPVPFFEETGLFETDESAVTPPPPPADHTTPLGARISVRPQVRMPFPSEAEVERLLALPTPPLISLSPPSVEECLARCLDAPVLPSSPLFRVPHPYGSPNHVRAPRGFKAAMGESSTTAARPTRDHREDYGFIGTLDAEIRRQRAKEVGYGIDSFITESRHIDQGQRVSPGDCVVNGAGGFSFLRGLGTNNMPPKRTSAAATRVAAVAARAATAAPMTAAAIEQLIEARVSEALPNHETL
ncbi:hypothetical protein Tco_0631689 [Tanacetum coccineum]